ncbi:hypothetical protein CDAR_54531 [Caerostris darwini]|uniref:Uncharacterized protein n=1 Tax=Caerostris darwini TaxID=1538125 RepID=A0AAV4T432_9ARAC|nr:hypothetical protein CDAR_54531 [Caerostris darwini]
MVQGRDLHRRVLKGQTWTFASGQSAAPSGWLAELKITSRLCGDVRLVFKLLTAGSQHLISRNLPAKTQSRHREQRIANAFRIRMSSGPDPTVPFALHASAINYGDIIDLRLWSPTDVWRRTLEGIQFDICIEWKRDVASNCFRGQLEFNAGV